MGRRWVVFAWLSDFGFLNLCILIVLGGFLDHISVR